MVQLLESYQNQGFYLGLETLYADSSPANKRLLSIDAPFKSEIETETFTPSGDTVPSLVVVNDEWASVDASGKPDFQAFPYFMSSLWGTVTPTNPSGSVYLWTFTHDGRTPLAPASYTAIYGSRNRAYQCAGLVWTKYGMTVNRDGIDFTAMALAKQLETGHVAYPRNERQTIAITGSVAPTGGTFTLTYAGQTTAAIAFNATGAAIVTALNLISTLTPNQVSLVSGGPINTTPVVIEFVNASALTDATLMTGNAAALTGGTGNAISVTETRKGGTSTDVVANALFPGHFDVYLDTTWAGLGTTKLLYCYDFELETPERIARTRPINSTKSSDGLVETEDQEFTVQMTMGVDATMETMLANLRAGTKIFVRLDALGATISTTYKYMVRHDMCILLTEVGDFQSSDNVLVVPISGVLARDSVSGFALKAFVQNTLSAL
jgi:hypothetical protein